MAGVVVLMAMAIGPVRAADGVVRYEDFGAKGDGENDDLGAIAEAHAHANDRGAEVRARDGATYYLGGAATTAIIRTDTDFGTARFVIDDREVENRGKPVFEIRSDLEPIRLDDLESLERAQRELPISLPQDCLVEVTDDSVRRYIRRGGNRNRGRAQTDVFLVDRSGNVDATTPVLWDFESIGSAVARPIDEDLLTVRGGHFTTIANASRETGYYSRGLSVKRSRVLIEGMQHHITGEGEHGAPYGGFIHITRCARVMVRDAVLTGHKTYHKIGSAGRRVPMGSYDILLNKAIDVRFVNCRQSNDIHDRRIWGIMGSNFCKNLLLDGCRFSRFDAHMGVTNATIRDSTIGHMGIQAIGFGTLRVENTTVRSRHFISLRRDYGSTWRGEFVIRDCVFEPQVGGSGPVELIGGSNDGRHDFGYATHMPARITIESLRIDDSKLDPEYRGAFVFTKFNLDFTSSDYTERHPYVRTGKVVLRNVTTARDRPIRLAANPFPFRDAEVEVDRTTKYESDTP